MWVLSFKSKEEWNIYNKRTLQFKISICFYSRNYYVKGKKIYFTSSGIISGEEKNKKEFFDDLKKEKMLEKIEINGDFFIAEYSEKETNERAEAAKTVYNSKIIFLKPCVIDEKGFETYHIGSFERSDLEKILKIAEKIKGKGEFELLSFKEQKVKNLMIESIVPDLSVQQKKVFELALKNNYYGFPRKIRLSDLAKQLGLSIATVQFHLAKAEAKLMPFFSEKL